MGERFEKIKIRSLTIIIGVPLVVLIIYAGGPTFHLFIGLIAILGSIELNNIFKNKYNPSLLITILATLFFLYRRSVLIFLAGSENLLFSTIILIVFLINFVKKTEKKYMVVNISLTIFIAIYIGHLLSLLIDIRYLADGEILLIFVLFTTWMSDAAAYIVGIKFGKKHIFPEISPNKTMEGSIGGLIGGSIAGLFFYKLLPIHSILLLALGLIAAVTGQLGDLFESIIKRNFGVKDSSTIIPGHGGILDCMDSILFSATVLYFFFHYLSF